jgi:large subunit ribosomal protein L4
MKIDVKDIQNKTVGSVTLDESVFGLPERKDILHRVVRWQLAKRRCGNHKVKTISEVSGTGKKPWRQKGTGRARTGTLRSPIFRGGATIHGPVVRDHSHELPKKVRALGLKTALSAKFKSGSLVIVDNLDVKSNKTKDVAKILDNFGFKSALFIDADEINANFANAVSNIIGIDALPHQGLNVYDILRRDNLVLTKAAIEKVEGRLK